MSESWYQIQYSALTQPVPLAPSDQVNPTWFPQWMQPIDQAVLPVEYRHTLPDFFSLGDPIPPAAPAPDYGWYRPADEPVLPEEFRYQLQSMFDPANWQAIIATDSGVFFPTWMQPIDQPVLPIEYRYTIPDLFVRIDETDFVAGASPPTAQPLSLEITLAQRTNTYLMDRSANSIEAAKSQNSVDTA